MSRTLSKKAKNKRYGKLSRKDELREVGELVLQGQLMIGNASEYVKRDWGEQYRQALLKSKQVNELKLTDFEFPSNESELNIESDEQVSKGKEEQIEVEQDIQGNEDTYEQDFDALLAEKEIESTNLETENNRSNEKNKGIIEQDKQINKKTIKNDISNHDTNEESQSQTNSQHDEQKLEEWENSEGKRQRNRTGVTMKEAIENHEEEMMMKKKITGLSALVSSQSPKKPKQLFQQSKETDQNQSKNGQQFKEHSNTYRSEGKENNSNCNSNSNSIGFNCSEQQKDLMKKIFADRVNAEEENTFMEIESDRKEQSQTFDIYAQMRVQKMKSLKMKKRQVFDEKDENKRKQAEYSSELELKKKQEQFQEEYVKRKIREQEELKKKQFAEESSSAGIESGKGANNGKVQKSYQENSNNFLRECFQLNTPPPQLISINKSQKLDQNTKGSSSLSFLVSNSNKQIMKSSNSAEISVNEDEKERMRKVTVKPSSSAGLSTLVSGGIYDQIKNSRNTSQSQGFNLTNPTTKTSTIQLLNTIYSKKN